MQRLIRLSFIAVLMGMLFSITSYAQTPKPQQAVSGRVAQSDVRVFVKDSTYIIDRDYVIAGTLIIEPGTDVVFYPNGRLIDSTGGRIIADGYAKATYTANPDGINPISTYEPLGYADFRYFFYSGTDRTINVGTSKEITVNPDKYNYIYHVVLDTQQRRLYNLDDPSNTAVYSKTVNSVLKNNPNRFVVSYEQAIMFIAGRMNFDPQNFDGNLKTTPWSRIGGKSPSVAESPITFKGAAVGNASREWGHIIILPGSRAAFFRNAVFENFRKDTTVDRLPLYAPSSGPQYAALNAVLNKLTNGSGGAITTFSSRTWLIDVKFNSNMARNRGGALNILASPGEFAFAYPGNPSSLPKYAANKNPNITDPDGSTSKIIENHPILMIDNIDESDALPEPFGSNNNTYRQALDDGRLAVYLARMRNMAFNGNYVQLANTKEEIIGGTKRVYDNVMEAANYPFTTGNVAYGGAIYIGGEEHNIDRQIEIGFGINNSLMIGGQEVQFNKLDQFNALMNEARNYQKSMNTEGARGGAIYVGSNTSLIVAGQFNQNVAKARYFGPAESPDEPDQNDYSGTISAGYARGGAIYVENSNDRLQVRGGPERENVNPTYFISNRAGSGGAIFVDGNAFPEASPVIGGSDSFIYTRDYGFDIKFESNSAIAYGGAIATKRNMSVNGSGGVEADALLGYDGKYPVKFNLNTAGYAGGAIDIRIPNAFPPLPVYQRVISLVRAEFTNNLVGDVEGNKMADVRGGGAIYSLQGDLNLVKGVDFVNNVALNSNGGAIALINPQTSSKRFFLSDLDHLDYDMHGMVQAYESENGAFTGVKTDYPADVRMMTRFIDNKAMVDDADLLASQSGSGTTQVGTGTLTTTNDILATSWINESTGLAVGMGGMIIKLTNGGQTWSYRNSGTNYRLTSISFATPTTGFVAGDRGVLLKTTDAGNSWSMINTGTDKQINSIYFYSTQMGFAVCNDGLILKTNDGGATWITSQPTQNNLNSVYFTDAQNGYAVGDFKQILFTTNGGSTWNFRPVNGLSQNLNSVFFRSTTTGFAVGDHGTVLATNDGGATWNMMPQATINDLNSLYFTGQNVGYIVGQFGTAYKTDDGGNTWTSMDIGTTYSINSVYFPELNTGYIAGATGLIKKTTDAGASWTTVEPSDKSMTDVVRYHPETMLPENGIGLGGAIYILDSVTVNRMHRIDSVMFNRVRVEDNEAFTGSAIYSDNFDLKLIFNRSLITGNVASSEIGMEQNVITGPKDEISGNVVNEASSDLAGATIYGEIQGPLPSHIFSEAANSIYNNSSRFLIRLPDAPNTKGVLAGTTGIGFGGTDTLRGNYWGHTEANVNFTVPHIQNNPNFSIMETFFVQGDANASWLPFLYPELINPNPADPRQKGPFESLERGDVAYVPITLDNGADDKTPGALSIPEKLVFSGHVYDLYDKGTDIKTADYSKRRMSPIEDFAVGIPPVLRRFNDPAMPSNGKYVKRWVRNPFDVEAKNDDGTLKNEQLAALQTEFKADKNGVYYQPVGYPIYLEAQANYDGLTNRSNNDPMLLNNSVFFVINTKTGDYIRVNLEQVSEDAPSRETFRGTVELVPDSTNRTDPTWRRTQEGLANLGAGPELLFNLYRDAYKEDQGTLAGRRYSADFKALARVPALFSNRPWDNGFATMPASNQVGGTSYTTYFAGERYNALPVRVGDSVMVVSRTVLWRDGVDAAAKQGLAFRITESTEPPVFTGDIVKLQTDTIKRLLPDPQNPGHKKEFVFTQFLNKVFLTEDRPYPVKKGRYSSIGILGDENENVAGGQGRDSIISVTAIDSNLFYDPRSVYASDKYARLSYSVDVDPASALSKWLIVNHLNATKEKDGAKGYYELAGIPINPFIVPGGEEVTVSASNYPPHYRTLDSLTQYFIDEGKDINDPAVKEELSKWIETFPAYMHAELYDAANARFLQQDTINVGPNYTEQYKFRIFVVDSTPVFLADDYTAEDINWLNDNSKLYVSYQPTKPECNKDRSGRLVANLTDKLRFQIDINTDDELEDNSPAAQGWDFRYGRTAYGFYNTALRLDDTTVIGDFDYDKDPIKWTSDSLIINQARPDWLADEYLYKYGSDTEKDNFGTDFVTYGKLNVRIPAAEALNLIKGKNLASGAYNTDTLFTVVANDGHGGVASHIYNVVINIQPQITTVSLPDATEDSDYNPSLTDTNRMIKIYDPNFGQNHTYRLIYPSTTENQIAIDNCFPAAGNIDLTNLKVTPEWLKINPVTGLLYGTPRVKDAPKDSKVVVVVTDENGLSTMKELDLHVNSVNHNPQVIVAPKIVCIDANSTYSTDIKVKDVDLERIDEKETLTVELLDLNDQPIGGFTATPSVINGGLLSDTATITIAKTGQVTPDPSGSTVTMKVRITDSKGQSSEIIVVLNYSEKTTFTATIRVENVAGAYQDLVFGTSDYPTTSTGEGNDNQPKGQLDNDLCEIELPPTPVAQDVFDARWQIPTRNGILRNIFPTALPNSPKMFSYKAQFNAGALDQSKNYPVTISWDPSEIPAVDDAVRNPGHSTWWLQDFSSQGNVFKFRMDDPSYNFVTTNIIGQPNGSRYEVIINNTEINKFIIVHDWNSSVDEMPVAGINTTRIVSVTPNPVNSVSTINFNLAKSANVTIQIFDNLGNVVAELQNGFVGAGTWGINWDGIENGVALPNGSYTVRMVAGTEVSIYPIMIAR